jgi:hypothetical protein
MNRDELKRAYKENPPAMGVYLVRNLRSNRFVLGSSQNLNGSLNRYKFTLQMGRPGDTFIKEPALLADYKAEGAEAFEFVALDTLKPKTEPGWDPVPDLEELEDLWRETLKRRGWTPY